jgi:predicted short-subunit dehydrogenase-like oxidoreductase (DUF2520 family)
MTIGGGPDNLWIVGPGRVGLALGRALVVSGWSGKLTFLGRRPDTAPLEGLGPRIASYATLRDAPDLAPPRAVILAVPDGAIGEVATTLAADLDLPPAVVIHTSGALPSDVLSPLAVRGSSIGSMHPLVAIPDPESGAAKLAGAWFGIEGDAEAVRLARRVVEQLGGHELLLDVGTKPLYHAAAVMASNHVVAVMDAAIRMIARCGIDPDAGRTALGELARGAIDDVSSRGPLLALTGPVVRGDVETVRAHLDHLSGDESRLYSVLAREALCIASARGLSPDAVASIEAILPEKFG